MTQTAIAIAPFERTVSLGKVDYNGSGRKNCLAEIKVKWKDGRLSFTGAIWNPWMTDYYCGGQNREKLLGYFPKLQRLCELWERWHLNDMRAGCEHQRQYAVKHSVGDTCQQCGYRYGTAWLREEVPNEVIAEIVAILSRLEGEVSS